MPHKGFIAEFNRPLFYEPGLGYALEDNGAFSVQPLPHKTSFHIRYGTVQTFSELKQHIKSHLNDGQPTASCLLVSL